MKPYLEKIYTRAGRRLLSLGQRHQLSDFPGAIRVAGFEVTGLKPLGGFFQPGVTKAGRLSFTGYCDGQKVKVYSVHSPAQSLLRQDLQQLNFSSCAFPELVAIDENLVVEAWVEGKAVSLLKGAAYHDAQLNIERFLIENLERNDLQSIAIRHSKAFCYLQDYLLSRLGVWRHWSLIANFVERWQACYSEISTLLPCRLSHPDLSAANLVREHSTGRILIIDNELIGVGRGWILDGRNSLLRTDIDSKALSLLPRDFLESTWRLRQLGSALDANDFSQVKVLCLQ
ncbi:hypothetical protein [Ectopseudomonas mendocina]|uniref:hypothetical protein n=1 Tax=Ectopseudomonas mendocina TaxID=300 RepID=UPI00376EDF24